MISISRPKALIVGGSSEGGLGEKIAQNLRMRDYFDGRLAQTMEVEVLTPKISALDIANEYSIGRYVEEHGPFRYIVYCAGVNHLNWVKDLDSDEIVDDFATNVFGFMLLMAEHEKLHPEAQGSAVAIASDAARNPMRGSTVYCASKAALLQAAKTMARELAPRWRINTVSPSIIEGTPMTEQIDATVPGFRGWDPEKMREYERTQLPLGRRAAREEVAHVVCDVLFGPLYQTGSDVHVTGGK